MPHVIVKLWPGRTEEQKNVLADKITRDVIEVIGCEDKSVSVSFEEIPRDRWAKDVYKPDILDKPDLLYKKPGYRPADEDFR